ncbi:DUF4193 domain-containing protein [Georgenia subflava]|uniref:DUF4193 family protein n=1 Tax=Georgenia subflava TaxID=1622177 RepID=A0A6N7EL41_9MICO|nr:DUF4193 domain-containing protein [Georgenia subflava]MPV35984.1 DUF4193 family protein [Georgenia subflava]
MATDYDAPRKDEADAAADPLGEIITQGTARRGPDTEVEESDTVDGVDLPGAVIDDELSVRVIPQQGDEFTCSRCFLVHHRSQLASDTAGELICSECAA